jgi:hypothetical protein
MNVTWPPSGCTRSLRIRMNVVLPSRPPQEANPLPGSICTRRHPAAAARDSQLQPSGRGA